MTNLNLYATQEMTNCKQTQERQRPGKPCFLEQGLPCLDFCWFCMWVGMAGIRAGWGREWPSLLSL